MFNFHSSGSTASLSLPRIPVPRLENAAPAELERLVTEHVTEPALALKNLLPRLPAGSRLHARVRPAGADPLSRSLAAAQAGLLDTAALEALPRGIRVEHNGEIPLIPGLLEAVLAGRAAAAGPDFWRGREVWVVGASSGLGRAAALQLHDKGARVFALARRADKLEDLKRLSGGNITPLAADVRNWESLAAAREQWLARSRTGRLGAVLYCAGGATIALLEKSRDDDIRATINTNLLGSLYLVNVVREHWDRESRLALVASLAATAPWTGGAAYVASKAGQHALALALADADSPRVTAVLPGYFDSEIWDKGGISGTPLEASLRLARPFMPSSEEAAATMIGDVARGERWSFPGTGVTMLRSRKLTRAFGRLSGRLMPRLLG